MPVLPPSADAHGCDILFAFRTYCFVAKGTGTTDRQWTSYFLKFPWKATVWWLSPRFRYRLYDPL